MKIVYEVSLDEGLGNEMFHKLFSNPRKALEWIKELVEEVGEEEMSEEVEEKLEWLKKNEKKILRNIKNSEVGYLNKIYILFPGDELGYILRKRYID